MIELKNTTQPKGKDTVITVNEVIKMVIKKSPPMDTKREDMQRGKYYYLSGRDPDTRNQI